MCPSMTLVYVKRLISDRVWAIRSLLCLHWKASQGLHTHVHTSSTIEVRHNEPLMLCVCLTRSTPSHLRGRAE